MSEPNINIEDEKRAYADKADELAQVWVNYLNNTRPSSSYVHSFKPGFEFDHFDYFISRDEMFHHFLEVKCRRNTFDKYKYVLVPLSKRNFADYLERINYKLIFLCEWSDGRRGWIDLSQEPDYIKSVVRKDRMAESDHAFYSRFRFKIIE